MRKVEGHANEECRFPYPVQDGIQESTGARHRIRVASERAVQSVHKASCEEYKAARQQCALTGQITRAHSDKGAEDGQVVGTNTNRGKNTNDGRAYSLNSICEKGHTAHGILEADANS